MFKFLSLFSLVTMSILYTVQSANAQAAYYSQAQTGVYGRASYATNNNRMSDSATTSNHRISSLPRAGIGRCAGVYGVVGRNGLPPTRLDSFVKNAGAHKAHIYGDEGTTLPPYEEFSKVHRINTGIEGLRDRGITTGHGSYLPDAWGGDEFVDGPEFTMSGANGGNPQHYSQGQYLGSSPSGSPAARQLNAVQQIVSPNFGFTFP